MLLLNLLGAGFDGDFHDSIREGEFLFHQVEFGAFAQKAGGAFHNEAGALVVFIAEDFFGACGEFDFGVGVDVFLGLAEAEGGTRILPSWLISK